MREFKGTSVICFPQEYVVLDLETTGLSPIYDEIIEIGALKVSGGVQEEFQTLIKPNRMVSYFITDLTGISNDMLKNAPSIHTVLPALRSFIGNLPIVAHNAHFDINFLYDNFQKTGFTFSNDFIDTLRISRKLFPDQPRHTLNHICAHLSIRQSNAHRALSDVMTTHAIFNQFNAHVQSRGIDIETLQKPAIQKRKAAVLPPPNTGIDGTHPLHHQTCVFTGNMSQMTRAQAMQKIVDLGGIVSETMTKRVSYLIIGDAAYSNKFKDIKSTKQRKAEQMILGGSSVKVISESVFLGMLSNAHDRL